MADKKLDSGSSSDDRTADGAPKKSSDHKGKKKGSKKNADAAGDELKATIGKLSSENEELRMQLEKVEAENQTLEVVVARTAELESEVSKLQQDLVSAVKGLEFSSEELSNLKNELDGMRGREKEKDEKLEKLEKEKATLAAELAKAVVVETKLRNEMKKTEEEMNVLLNVSKRSTKELESIVERMKSEIKELKNSLADKERIINEKKCWKCNGSRRELKIIRGSAIVAVAATIWIVCRAKKV
ncbi:uncharacterized protein LOC127254255 [Andrographis paniculata]|uniref:uncharacterized protein LOC127254255 n=1 Tax=Andrographis paniculata TaxID=175694 RepID=UPI0021E7962A|nr:uncharacterized protein LOC127254255 [Andrographis paniculata]